MQLSTKALNLPYLHPFGISRWTKTEIANVVVELSDGEISGIGEGAPNQRYSESQESSLEYLSNLDAGSLQDISAIRSFLDKTQSESLTGIAASIAALDIAYYDFIGKEKGLRVSEIFGLEGLEGPVTSFTIAIDTPKMIEQKTLEASEYKVLKVKLGSDQDEAIMSTIRRVSEQVVRVDANEGWTDKEVAIRNIEWLQSQNVELVEQPMPAGNLEDVAWLKERTAMPLFADEDCKNIDDLSHLREAYDGVNVKVDKSGGLKPARMLIESAKNLDLKVMVGCMGSSSLSISAAAHISLDVDFVDLDGNLLLARDIYEGVGLDEGRIRIPDKAGVGVVLKS